MRAVMPGAALSAVLLLAGPSRGWTGSELTERFEKTVALDHRGSFRIENVNGSVVLEAWDQASVQIEAEKKARDEESLRELEIVVSGEGSRVEVKTVYPRRRRHQEGSVSYHIRLPADARVDAETVNGRVEVRSVHGELRVTTVNGSVAIEEAGGDVEANTVNGSIRASYRNLSDGTHRYTTTNGSIVLELPEGAGGAVEARTVHGSITTDFPVTIGGAGGGTWGRKHLRGQFGGGGGGRFDLTTVNGSVRIGRS